MDDPIEIWQSQNVEPITMPIEELRRKAVRFESHIRSRNLRETIISVAMIPVFLLFLRWFPAPLAQVGSWLNIAGLVYVIYRLNGPGAAATPPAGAGWDNTIAFHRHELERHRDLLRTVLRWYLGPLVPGLVIFIIGSIEAKVRPGHPLDWWKALPPLALFVVSYWGAVRLNNRAADCLQRQIDELDLLARP